MNIRQGMKQSKIFKDRVKEYHVEKNKEEVRKFYDLPPSVEFIPVTLYEHKFARFVLIQERYSFGFMAHSGLVEQQENEQNDEGESDVPVAV